MVSLIRWLMPLNARCNLSPLCTDKTREVPDKMLKETRFVWIEPANEGEFVKGPAEDEKIKPVRIPGYVWPKEGRWEGYGGLVGLFFHGGGYMMGNGSESFGELGEFSSCQSTGYLVFTTATAY